MNLNNGNNKTTKNLKCDKNSITERINELSKKNFEKDKQKSTKTKIKNNKFPTISYNNGLNNEKTYISKTNNIGIKKNNKLYGSVNSNYYKYEYVNDFYENDSNEYKTQIKEKRNSKKTNIDNNKTNREKEKEKEKKLKKEKYEKERQRLIEDQKEKERIEKEKRDKEQKERIEREKREKEYLEKEKEKEKERQRQKLLEEEKERKRKEKEKKEKEEKEKELQKQKEKEQKEREEKEKKEKEDREKNIQKILNKYKVSDEPSKTDIKEEKNLSSEISSITTSKIGLRNLGNTCFMNTCLQNLIHSEFFILKLFSKSSLLSSRTKISKQFYSLCKEVSSCISSACSPYDFKSAFGSKHSMFSGYGQHDTQEFCRILLEDMNSELNEVLHPAPYKELSTLNKTKIECDKEFDEVFRKRENSLIMDVFYGQLINIFKCECNFETYSFEKILDLPLLLPKERISIDIKDLLKDYFECERIKFETKCENCKKKEWHMKQIKISQPPNILILSLQRQNPRTGTKNNSYVDFSDELDMSIYLDHECWNKNDAKYSLYGIGNHTGSIDFGHYYAYIKINNSWYEFNDSSVSPYSKGSSNSSRNAYILFYKKNNL